MNIIVFPLFKNCINSHEFVKLYYFTKFAGPVGKSIRSF